MPLTMRVVLVAAAIVLPQIAHATAPVVAPPTDNVIAKRCKPINIGTPDRPRWVQDPGCGSGR